MQTKQAEVLEKLRAAFPSTKLRSDGAFTSWGMTYPDAEAYGHHLDGKTWEQLDRDYLTRRSDALGFLGTQHLISVLPTYLWTLIENRSWTDLPDLLLTILAKPDETNDGLGHQRFGELIDGLSDAQRVAVAAVLWRFTQDHDEAGGVENAQRALDTHWKKYLET